MNFENLDNGVNLEVIKKKQNKNKFNEIKKENKKERKKVYSFTLKPSILKKLEEAAKKNNRSKSEMLEMILEKYL